MGRNQTPNPAPDAILVVDIGGTNVKLLASGHHEPRKFASGKRLKPGRMVDKIRRLTSDWEYQAVSIGFPGLVGDHGPRAEPANLGPGWVGFDFAAAFERPVRVLNDAALQALGSYEGGRMLFLGLGTGFGSTLIAGSVLVPLELGNLKYDKGATLGEIAGDAALKRLGKKSWRRHIEKIVVNLRGAFVADYVVIGGGNARKLNSLPEGIRKGHNNAAFRGGVRLWQLDAVSTQTTDGKHLTSPAMMGDWKLI